MDSTKAQDITRHIFKDEDKGCEYIKNLALSDSVEVLTKIIPALINEAEKRRMLMMLVTLAGLMTFTVKLLLKSL